MNRVLSLLLLLLPASIILEARDINLTHLTVKDGLLSSTVYHAMQDSKGFVWLCTETGVNRYDGRTFEKFTINNGLADNEIFKCYEDSKHRIWFLSYNGKLSYYFQGTIYNEENTPWLTYPYIGAFLLNCAEDKDGGIYISTSNGDALLVKNHTVRVIRAPFRERQSNHSFISANLFFESDSIKKFSTDTNGYLYKINLFSGGVVALGKQQDVFNNAKPLGPDSFFCKDRPRLFLAETTLVSYVTAGQSALLDIGKCGISAKLVAFLPEKNGCWLGTAGEGAFFFDARPDATHQNNLHLLPHMMVSCILKDNEGNIWFTTHGDGVFILKANSAAINAIPSGITCSAKPINIHGHKYLVTGDDKGNVCIRDGDNVFRSFHLSGEKFNRVRDIFNLGDTVLLAGTDNAAIYKYHIRTNKWTPFGIDQGYKNGTFAPDGSFWACTQEIMYKMEGNSFLAKYRTNKLGKCTGIAILSNSEWYVGTIGMLYKVRDNGNDIKVILKDRTLKTGVNDLKLVNGTLWVSTHGNGVFLLRGDTIWQHISTSSCGMASDVCQKLFDDGWSYVWLATNMGISVFDRLTGKLFCNISTSTGLTSDDVKNIYTDGNDVYVATAEGVNIFKLSEVLTSAPPPKVYVTSFRRGKELTIDPDSILQFPHQRGPVDICFTAITYQSPEDAQYEYKLGNSPDWQRTRTTNISLINLPPGTHKLLLRAKKYNSAWSEPAILTMIVSPLWYETKLFLILVAMVFLSSVFYIAHLRVKWIRTRANEQNILHQRITELENKSLAYQMNPHFIFNSLNTVQQFLLTKEPRQGISYLSDFATLMRKMLENSRQPAIPLGEEIDFLKCYLLLEKTRFSDRFDYDIHVDQQLLEDDISIPPILFQPLLENAIKHGIAPAGKGNVSLTLMRNGDFLTGRVEDNGVGILSCERNNDEAEKKKESTALKVLEERLKLIKDSRGSCGSMKITDKSQSDGGGKGTIVEVTIPITE